MTLDEAIKKLRSDPASADAVRNAFLGPDAVDSAQRFAASPEFAEVLKIASPWVKGRTIVDLGSGIGISSYAFAKAGAAKVYSVEPDTSDEVGRGAAQKVAAGLPIEQIAGYGESIPLPDKSVDMVYVRQVLHHTTDLNLTLRECDRILKPGGAFFACREHVVDDEAELARFLEGHVVHQLAGGENAYRLDQYLGAIRSTSLKVEKVFGLYDSLINSFPMATTAEELRDVPVKALRERFGILGTVLAAVPGVKAKVRRRLERRTPGRMYSFFAFKPA